MPRTVDPPGIYLREDAANRLTEPVGVPNLTRKQQAEILGVPYTTLWRLTQRHDKAGERAIFNMLIAAAKTARRWDVAQLRFDDLFEIRGVAGD